MQLATAAALPGRPRIAGAETCPARLLHLVVGFPPGHSADISARPANGWASGSGNPS